MLLERVSGALCNWRYDAVGKLVGNAANRSCW